MVELKNTEEKNYEDLLFDIFKWGALPQRLLSIRKVRLESQKVIDKLLFYMLS